LLEGSTLGTLVELMVQAEILAGSEGRLIPSRFEPDVDHRDLIVADVGGYGALWLQVKGTTHPDKEGRVVAFANYPVDAIPESDRLFYVGVTAYPGQRTELRELSPQVVDLSSLKAGRSIELKPPGDRRLRRSRWPERWLVVRYWQRVQLVPSPPRASRRRNGR